MAVGLPIGTRNIKSGIQGNPKTQPIPTGPSQTVRVAPDPGVAGGPGNVPLRAFGTGGSDVLGAAFQNISADVMTEQRALEAQALKTRLQAEEVQLGLILTETNKKFDVLAADVGDTTKAFSQIDEKGNAIPLTKVQGEELPLSTFDIYRQKSQQLIDKTIAELDQKNFSQGSKNKLTQQLQSASRIHSSAVAKSVKELKENEYAVFVGRSYKSSAERHQSDLVNNLAENAVIFKDTRLLLGDTKSIELLQLHNETAALTLYDEHFDEGRFDQAQAALDGTIAKKFISPQKRREKITEIRKARTAAFIKDEVKRQSDKKIKEGIIDGKDGKQYQLTLDENGNVVSTVIPGLPGTKEDLAKRTAPTKNGGLVELYTDDKGEVFAKPVAGFPVVDDFTKNTVELADGSFAQLIMQPSGKLKAEPISGTETVPQMVTTFTGMIDAIEEETGLSLDNETKASIGKALAGLKPESISAVQAKIDAAKLLIEDGTITFKNSEEINTFFKSLIPKDALTGGPKGVAEAEEIFAKAERLKDLGFREPFEVDEGATNSIIGVVEAGLASVSKGGVLTKVPGAENLIPTLVSMAEDNLIDGSSRTIGSAVKLAFEQFVDQGGKLPKVVTGASIVKALKAASQKPTLEQQKSRQAKRDEVIDKFKSNAITKADLEESLKRLSMIDFTFMKKDTPLDFENAMGFRSSLVSLIGRTVAQIPGLGHLENKEVTKARLMFALIARDIVRMISLSPRFAVKEQQLIQSIFSGPVWWNSPQQAQNKVTTMLEIIADRMDRIETRLSVTNIDPAAESEMVDEADRLLEIRGRMNKFEFNIIRVTTVAQASSLSAVQANEHIKTAAMPDDIAIALNDRILGLGGKPRRKSRKPKLEKSGKKIDALSKDLQKLKTKTPNPK